MNEFSKTIWEQNYKGPDDITVEDTWKRLAISAAEVENENIKKQIENEFYDILKDFKFVPGGRIMANLGVKGRESTTLMNCFVHFPKDINLKDPDSIEGIYTLLKAQAHTLKSEGGYGMNFGWIRPQGSYVYGIGSRTPGVVKFMELWDKSSEIITQGSDVILGEQKADEKKKIRKGAQMGVLPVWHPEIENFIKAKQTPGRLTKFNLSVGITEGFMEALINNKKWDLVFPDTTYEKYENEWDGDLEYWKEKGYPIIVYKTIDAKQLWDMITYSTYTRNEPGVLFLDLFNKLNPLSYAEKIFTTNPCGEIGMATGVCNLGALNLVKFVKIIDHKVHFDFDDYKKAIPIAVRFLDNINDISRAPLPEYKESMLTKRRIGLGNMGLGSLHVMMGIEFGSPESLDLIEKIYKIKAETELLASAKLGIEKGSFKIFDPNKYFNTYWWNNLDISPKVKKEVVKIGAMRNSHRSMNAPNGNSSIVAGLVTGGIEPPYLLSYVRWVIVTEHERRQLKTEGLIFPDVYNGEWYETKHFHFDKKGDEEVLSGEFNNVKYMIDKNRGLTKAETVEDYGWTFAQSFYSKEELKALKEKGAFKTTSELSVNAHLDTLRLISKYSDMNNSKTTNIPEQYPYEDFQNLYLNAWKSGIKGITTYRAGTMTAVLEKIETSTNELEAQFLKAGNNIIKDVNKLPDEAISKIYILRDNNKKKWYVTVSFVSENIKRPFALFINTNCKENNEVTAEFIHAMETLLINKGIEKQKVDEQIKKYAGQSNTTKIARIIGMALRHNLSILDIIEVLNKFDIQISSFMFHLSKLLSKFVENGTIVAGMTCPTCKSEIVYNDGCKICKDCGWTAC
jgi:ribonucleoside-diphosphate reductase alpha chain